MPNRSRKQELIKYICRNALIVAAVEDRNFLEEFDDAIDNLIAVKSFRTGIPRSPIPKSNEWYTRILPAYDEDNFRSFVRVSRANFQLIYDNISESKLFKDKKQLPVDLQLAVALYKFGHDGNGSGNDSTAALFGIGNGGTIIKILRRVINALLEIENKWICWPDENERNQICMHMENTLPGCVGYIDGTHINLFEAPMHDPESYFTRKQKYAIQLQAICDEQRSIRHVYVGFPGSVHDARVYANSSIGKNEANFLAVNQWICGDSAYRNSKYVVTPFRNNATEGTVQERAKFNMFLSSFRVKIECCFAILKGVFPSLKCLRVRVDRDQGHMLACMWIRACIILFNMTKPSYEFDENFIDEETQLDGIAVENNQDIKRTAIFNFYKTNIL